SSEKNYDDDKFLSDDEIEIEYTYGVFIKLENEMSLLAKIVLESNNSSDDEIIKHSRNKNSIPKTSSLSSAELSIARNVLEICKKIIVQFIIDHV
ncbi:430_t:CDS:2, partial [Dentiscutata erythropus]